MRALLAALLIWALAACASVPPVPGDKGRFLEWESDSVAGLPPQHITLWLPPGYDRDKRRYPVLYMHDGQNLFDPAHAHYGKIWAVDQVLMRMVAAGQAQPHIVVGIWSPGEDRYRQYLPLPAAEGVQGAVKADMEKLAKGPIVSARYLQWLADEVKPTIDEEFRTLTGPQDTTIIGSSMGGIMSCYAAIERPDIFGKAGCVSAHWPIANPEVTDAHQAEVAAIWQGWLARKAPPPGRLRLWLDHGTVGLDAHYAPYQAAIARDLAARGWVDGRDFTAREYPGADHSEVDWNARLPAMLEWLWRAE